MRLTCLVDDCVRLSSPLWGEHGLAFLIETADRRLLWDTGSSGTVLLHNLAELQIDPAAIDALAISHGHQDHTGGLAALAPRVRPSLPLYAHPALFQERFSRHGTELPSVGIPVTRPALEAPFDLRLSADPVEILPGVWTSGEITPRPHWEGRSDRHLIRHGDDLVPDPYRDDLSLVLELPDGLVLVCGCCHAGLLNTLHLVETRFERHVLAIVGGTHLAGADPAQLDQAARALLDRPALRHLWLNHCSGDRAIAALRAALGPAKVDRLPAGTVLELTDLRRG